MLDPNVHSVYPRLIEDNVYLCGFTSPKSYGAMSYFIQHPSGNWLVDAPRFDPHLVDSFKSRGGLRYIFLTHRDDVADAHLYARHFGAERIIHEADQSAQPGAEILVQGDGPFEPNALGAYKNYCWYSWEEQTRSMRKLLDYRFEWVLPGHGNRIKLDAKKMKKELEELIRRM